MILSITYFETNCKISNISHMIITPPPQNIALGDTELPGQIYHQA